jgi:leucyl-tRNA synthetase
LQLLAPFAPHVAEELWQQLGHNSTIHTSKWPTFDEKYLVSDKMIIAIQVNGKVRGEVEMPIDAEEVAVIDAAQANDRVKAHTEGKTIVKTIYVPGKILNIVVK